MINNIIKIDNTINEIYDKNQKKVKWSNITNYYYIPHHSEFSLIEKASIWWNWFESLEFKSYVLKCKYDSLNNISNN